MDSLHDDNMPDGRGEQEVRIKTQVFMLPRSVKDCSRLTPDRAQVAAAVCSPCLRAGLAGVDGHPCLTHHEAHDGSRLGRQWPNIRTLVRPDALLDWSYECTAVKIAVAANLAIQIDGRVQKQRR